MSLTAAREDQCYSVLHCGCVVLRRGTDTKEPSRHKIGVDFRHDWANFAGARILQLAFAIFKLLVISDVPQQSFDSASLCLATR